MQVQHPRVTAKSAGAKALAGCMVPAQKTASCWSHQCTLPCCSCICMPAVRDQHAALCRVLVVRGSDLARSSPLPAAHHACGYMHTRHVLKCLAGVSTCAHCCMCILPNYTIASTHLTCGCGCSPCYCCRQGVTRVHAQPGRLLLWEPAHKPGLLPPPQAPLQGCQAPQEQEEGRDCS
jgi:hypothetical protein